MDKLREIINEIKPKIEFCFDFENNRYFSNGLFLKRVFNEKIQSDTKFTNLVNFERIQEGREENCAVATVVKNPNYYVDIIDGNLILYKIVIEIKDNFYIKGVEVGKFIYYPEFRELKYDKNGIAIRKDFLKHIINYDVAYGYFFKLFKSEPYFDFMLQILKTNNIESIEAYSMIPFIYLFNINKYMEFFIKNDYDLLLQNLLNYSFYSINSSEKIEEYLDFGKLNQYSLQFLKHMHKKKNFIKNMKLSELRDIIISFDQNNIKDFYDFVICLDKLNLIDQHFFGKITNIPNIDIKFINYIIKNIFSLSYNYIDMTNDDMVASVTNFVYQSNICSNINNFISVYFDYLNLKTAEEELYPDDLIKSHDKQLEKIRMEREQLKKIEQEEKMMEERRRLSEQKFLFSQNQEICNKFIFQDEEKMMEVVVPEDPYELVLESNHMNNCVNTYINQVLNGHVNILFIRKEGNPYITVEIRDNHIFQAKRKNNQKISCDDNEFISSWCAACGLTVVRV